MESALLSEFMDLAAHANEHPSTNRSDNNDNLAENWLQLKANLQNFCIGEFNDHAHFSAAREQVIETAQIFSGASLYRDIFIDACKSQQGEIPWHSQRLAYDQVMQADLVTLYNNCGTPIHSYNGAAGWLVVLSGELTVTRYREIVNYDNDVNLLSKLEPVRTNRYHAGAGTLIDSAASPVLELQTRTSRCVLINFHLRDHNDLEHYFYFPTYQHRDENAFFSRRVNGEL